MNPKDLAELNFCYERIDAIDEMVRGHPHWRSTMEEQWSAEIARLKQSAADAYAVKN